MGKLFHHHILNDVVHVENGSAVYVDAGARFAADNDAAVPVLPAGAIERIYEPGVRHAISNGSSVIAGGPQPWPFGDAAVAVVSKLLAAQAKRTIPPAPVTKPMPKTATTGKSTGTATVAS
ncbi:MAG TPA: hypothetical protein VGR79_04225 [Stellaceae bacterium]|nr:hypothetical protein [Stellaceae bacterium]